MQRRQFLKHGLSASASLPLLAILPQERFEEADDVLAAAVSSGQIAAAVLYVRQRQTEFIRQYGAARSADAMFLLGSISKPICVTALMKLYDQQAFALDDRLVKFVPQFRGDGREDVTLRQLLTHVCGLPDQLASNNALRRQHAGLPEFVAEAVRTPLLFKPGSQYQYSSMGILLACHVAEIITGTPIVPLVERTVLQPLQMQHSAIGLGRFTLQDMIPVQTEQAAPESGGGDPAAREWDWNSLYWRQLGAPWGGVHASAADVARFLTEFLPGQGRLVRPETARLMVTNQNPPGLTPRGLGFNVGVQAGSPGCSAGTFGHTGSTGTLAWADPARELVCVVLTSLPGRAVQPHPRELAAARVSAAVA